MLARKETMMQRQSLADMRAQYPQPVSERDAPHPAGAYGVGMALMLAHGAWARADESFPGEGDLAHVLCDLNPHLDVPPRDWTATEGAVDVEATLAYLCAEAITAANDAYDFETAWELAGRALDYQPGAALPA